MALSGVIPGVTPDWMTAEHMTGTSIMAVEYEGGVIIGADSRTSTGAYVANRVTDKLTPVMDRIFCCRSGSAADTQAIADIVAYNLKLHSIELGEEPLVNTAASIFRRICYDYRDSLVAGIICAGWDQKKGGQVYSIPLGGMCIRQPFAIGGSGSTYIYGYCDAHFKQGMIKEECIEFVKSSLALAIGHDGSSGGVIRIASIEEGGVERDVYTGQEIHSVKMQTSFSQVKLFIRNACEQATDYFVGKLKKDLEDVGLQVFLRDNIQHEGMDDSEADGIIEVFPKFYFSSSMSEFDLVPQKGHKKFRIEYNSHPKDVDIPKKELYFTLDDDDDSEYKKSLELLITEIKKRQRNPSAKMQASFSQVKLFISYAWEDATNDFVEKLKRDLEDTGLQVFLDKHEILPGDNIQHEVAKGMDEADGIIIVYFKKYPSSNWCDDELQMAQRSHKKIFPVRRISGPYQRNVDLALGGILYANFTLDNEVEYQKSLDLLIKGIEKNCVKK